MTTQNVTDHAKDQDVVAQDHTSQKAAVTDVGDGSATHEAKPLGEILHGVKSADEDQGDSPDVKSDGADASKATGTDKNEPQATATDQDDKAQGTLQDDKPTGTDATDEMARLKVDNDRLQKTFKETKRWGHDLTQKIKSAQEKITSYMETGALTQEEGKALLDAMTVSAESAPQDDSPLMVYSRIWDQELDNMRKYSDRKDIDSHVLAFQHLLKNGGQEELNHVFDTLSGIDAKDTVALTKAMLDMGKTYHDDVYADLATAGSLKGFKAKMQKNLDAKDKQIKKLQDELDTLKEQSPYIPGKGYGIPAGGSAKDGSDHDVSLNSVFTRARAGRL